MYHPPDDGLVSGTEFEFIELKNGGTEAVDLSGVSIQGGISFVFSEGFVLDPGEFAVVVSNEAAFRDRYPGVVVGGVFTRNLSNRGDVLEILDGREKRMLTVAYDDHPPWPVGADGWGYSLVPLEPPAAGDPSAASSWRLSSEIGGSPGGDDGAPFARTVTFRRGDSNADGRIDIADSVYTLRYLFAGGPECTCRDAADANDDGTVDVADAIRTLGHLFGGAGSLPEPHAGCGEDPTPDDLDCAAFVPCE
jgi:hypothetical protein